MKIVFIGLLAATFIAGQPAASFAQEKTSTATASAAKEKATVVVYIDSVRINFGLDYLDPQNITKIDVVKDKEPVGNNNGRIYITWKTPHPVFLSLADIAGMQSIKGVPVTKGANILYIVDDSVINDPGTIRIDPTYVTQVRVIDIADIPYLRKDAPFTAILQIRTKRLFPPPPPGQIIIRGAGSGEITYL
jgi:hypothetical protein